MKHLSLYLVIGLLISIGGATVVRAQEPEALPSPGITLGSPFYFLDRIGEAIREFITFNPEAKARFQDQ